jgi:group II intron reverse transcriptase/maturase
MDTTDVPTKTETKLKRIAWLSSRDERKVFNSLMHLFNEESLRDCFNELDGKKAVGIDGVDKAQYQESLDENIKDLIARMKGMTYRPYPVRQVRIPKEGMPGVTRPLGISNFEDKLVQKMTQKVLESIYDPIFHACSYGFRRGKGCHDAIRDVSTYLFRYEVQVVIDVDLANFFGTIDHKLLESILREKIRDERFIRYLIRMFKAGVLAEGELILSEEGVPQGSPCSPVLANIFAHYVIDEWFETTVKRHCAGRAELFRYGDDAVICCQDKRDAKRIKKALGNRLSKYGLKLNEEKTELVTFSKREANRGIKQGAFNFLGFMFYIGRSSNGFPIPKVKTNGKRFRAKLKKVNEWARRVRNLFELKEIWKSFCVRLEGHIRYYGVSFNTQKVAAFRHQAIRIVFKWLNRRSQRKSFDWERFSLFMKSFPPPKARVWCALY